MLTLTFLGVGSAFAKRNYQSNALLEAWADSPERQDAPDDVLLIDFGTTGPIALYSLMHVPGFSYLNCDGAINYPAVGKILITHLHSDHIGGLEELAAMNRHRYRCPQTNEGFKASLFGSVQVLGDLWDHSLRGGLGAVDGRVAQLSDYFEPQVIEPGAVSGRVGLLDRFDISIFPPDHIRISERFDWPSFGVLLTDRQTKETVLYSGDTRFDLDGMGAMMASANVCFHEVALDQEPNPVHTTLTELRTLPQEVRQRTWLYHFGDDWNSGAFDDVGDAFAGFAQPRVRYVLFE